MTTQQPITETIPHSVRQIGEGYCGEVFWLVGTNKALKRAKAGKVNTDMLKAEYHAQEAVWLAFRQYATDLRVPHRGFAYDIDDSDFWRGQGMLLPPVQNGERRFVMKYEYIRPVGKDVREKLIQEYCSPAYAGAASAFGENEDCLIRLYLGQHGTPGAPKLGRTFGLRNFPMTVDKMESLAPWLLEHLNHDIEYYAQKIGEGLAIVHWAARYDGRDIEWVVGGAPVMEDDVPTLQEAILPRFVKGQEALLSTRKKLESLKRTSYVWLLDFNQCKPISLDEAGVDMAVSAFFDNDPYYPRAGQGDASVWRTFTDAYLEISQNILDPAVVQERVALLPQLFIDKTAADPRASVQSEPRPPPAARPAPAGGDGAAEPKGLLVTSHRPRAKRTRPGRVSMELGEPES